MKRTRAGIPLLGIAYVVAAAANLWITVGVGRYLGAAALGTFALGLSVTRVFYAGVDLGLGAHLTRELSKDAAGASALASLMVSFRALLVVAGVVVASVGALLLDQVLFVFVCVAIGQGLLVIQGLYEAMFLGRGRHREVAALTCGSACGLVAGAVAGVSSSDIETFALSYALGIGAGLTPWAVWAARRLCLKVRLTLQLAALRTDLAASWRVGMSVLICIAALRAPVVILGVFCNAEEVGAFAAADMFLTAAAIAQNAVSNATFPQLSATFQRDPVAFRKTFWFSNLLLVVVGLATALLLTLIGPDIIRVFFPSRAFGDTQRILEISAWSAPCMLVVHHNIFVFAAAGRDRANVMVMTLWLLLISSAVTATVPAHRGVGAAWGVLIGRGAGAVALVVAILLTSVHRGRDDSR